MNRRGFLGLLAGAALGVASGMGLRPLSSDALDSTDFEQVYVPDLDTASLYPDEALKPQVSAFADFYEATNQSVFKDPESFMREEARRATNFAEWYRKSRAETRKRFEGPWSFSRVGDPIKWDHA